MFLRVSKQNKTKPKTPASFLTAQRPRTRKTTRWFSEWLCLAPSHITVAAHCVTCRQARWRGHGAAPVADELGKHSRHPETALLLDRSGPCVRRGECAWRGGLWGQESTPSSATNQTPQGLVCPSHTTQPELSPGPYPGRGRGH